MSSLEVMHSYLENVGQLTKSLHGPDMAGPTKRRPTQKDVEDLQKLVADQARIKTESCCFLAYRADFGGFHPFALIVAIRSRVFYRCNPRRGRYCGGGAEAGLPDLGVAPLERVQQVFFSFDH